MSKFDWNNKEKLYEIIKEAKNATDALEIMQLRAAGGNYKTLKYYTLKYNIDTKHFTQRHDKMVALAKNSSKV